MADSFGNPRHNLDGSIEYPRKGWEPPPPIEGYERDPKNKWKFIRKWLPCKHRREGTMTKPCGAIQIVAICYCNSCPLFKNSVSKIQCDGCQSRE